MSPVGRLLEVLERLPDDAQMPVGWIREQLEDGSARDEGRLADLTAAEAGRVVGRASSTIRSWCAAGEFPGAYKQNDKEWRIPPDAVREYVARQRGGDETGRVITPSQERALGRSGRQRRLRLVGQG